MNMLIPLMIIAALFVYMGFKWNNLRTKFAYLFITFGVLFVLFFIFLIVTGSSFNFSNFGEVLTSVKVYAVWMKGAASKVFETTGNVIGAVKNSTA